MPFSSKYLKCHVLLRINIERCFYKKFILNGDLFWIKLSHLKNIGKSRIFVVIYNNEYR